MILWLCMKGRCCLRCDFQEPLKALLHLITRPAVVNATLSLDVLGASAWRRIGVHLHKFALGACDAHHGFAPRELPQRVGVERLMSAVELRRQRDRVLVTYAEGDQRG